MKFSKRCSLRPRPTNRKTTQKAKAIKGDRPLKGMMRHYQPVYATYKGQHYKANVLKSGYLKLNGKLYDTPSAAGKAIITKGAVNGWNFWKYKDKSGELRRIADLRK